MAAPKLTKEERSAIESIRKLDVRLVLVFELAYLVPVSFFIIWGLLDPDPSLYVMALVVLWFFRGWHLKANLSGIPALQSALAKYATAFELPSNQG
uniref:Uncharacterized protein n=1 Tax=Schlesneria paludicola TaxID=360056 RepID=A0A7C2JZU0_9PLAN